MVALGPPIAPRWLSITTASSWYAQAGNICAAPKSAQANITHRVVFIITFSTGRISINGHHSPIDRLHARFEPDDSAASIQQQLLSRCTPPCGQSRSYNATLQCVEAARFERANTVFEFDDIARFRQIGIAALTFQTFQPVVQAHHKSCKHVLLQNLVSTSRVQDELGITLIRLTRIIDYFFCLCWGLPSDPRNLSKFALPPCKRGRDAPPAQLI